MNTNPVTYRLPIRMLCDRNQQELRIPNDQMYTKLGCDADLALGSNDNGMPEPSAKFFIYYTPGHTGEHFRNDFKLVQVDGFSETIIDEGKAEGFSHAYHENPYTKFGIRGKKLGSFNAYVPLYDNR